MIDDDPDTIEPVLRPAWSTVAPFNASHVLSGVRYVGMDVENARTLFDRSSRCFGVIAGFGPSLRYRRVGPWVPYGRDLEDELLEEPVSTRPWPWRWGDVVVSLLEFERRPLLLTFDLTIEALEAILGSMVELSLEVVRNDPKVLLRSAARWRIPKIALQEIPPGVFWDDRKNP